MKKIIAIAAILASAQASAFWGSNGDNMFDGNGMGDGDASFSMGFSGNARSSARGTGYGRGYNNYNGYNAPYGYGYAPYGAAPYGYAPVAAPVAPAAPQTSAQ